MNNFLKFSEESLRTRKLGDVLQKSFYLIGASILILGIPVILMSLYYGAGFWMTFTRVWAMVGIPIGFLLGIPFGMYIMGKIFFHKSKL